MAQPTLSPLVTHAQVAGFPAEVIDSHIHLSEHYSGGLSNEWLPGMPEPFQRDFSEQDFRAAVAKGCCPVHAAVFVECFNRPAASEARWVLQMVDDPDSIVQALVAQIKAQVGPESVSQFLDELRLPDGSLPAGLKGARMVFPACENNSPEACLDPVFIEGLRVLEAEGLHWEFCVNPSAAPYLARCVEQLPGMVFVVDHLAHNGNDGGEMESWGPAIDELGSFPNVYMKMGAVEEWDVPTPEDFLDRALAAFGFGRVLYESNWFVSEGMGDPYDRAARLLLDACARAGASSEQIQAVFAGNARRVYKL